MSSDNKGSNGTSMPSHEHYERNYGERKTQEEHYGRPRQGQEDRPRRGGRGRGRGGPMRRPGPMIRPMRPRNFVLDFNRFANRPEIQKRVTENFEHRMESGDTKELFHWASPPLNDYRVGNTVYVRFEGETEMHQYMVTAKFMRGEVEWKHPMPDGVRYELRLKKLN